MKTKIFCLLIAIMMLFGCVGCMPEDSDYDPLEGVDFNVPLSYTGEITVWIQAYDYEKTMMNTFVDKFNKRYPNIKVNVEPITPAQYQSTLQKASNLDGMPDIFWVSPQNIGIYNDWDVIMPLNAVIEKDGSFSTDNIVNESLSCFQQDGELWGIPRDFNQVVLYYNKDMFDAAGVAYPSATEAMSLEQFEKTMKDLKEGLAKSTKTNSYGETYKDCVVSSWDVCMTWDSMIWPVLKSYGAEVIREDGTYQIDGKPLLDSEEALNAFEWCMDITQKGYIEAKQATHQDSLAFKLERSPMYSHMRCNLVDLITPSGQYKGISNLGIAPFPNLGSQDNYYIGSGATGYGLYKRSKDIVAAWLFLKSIVSEETQEELSKTGVVTPANKAVLEDPNAEWRKFTDTHVGEGYNEPYIYRKEEAYTHINQFLQYINFEYQNSVYFDLSTLYCQITDLCKDRASAAEYLTMYANRIASYCALKEN